MVYFHVYSRLNRLILACLVKALHIKPGRTSCCVAAYCLTIQTVNTAFNDRRQNRGNTSLNSWVTEMNINTQKVMDKGSGYAFSSKL